MNTIKLEKGNKYRKRFKLFSMMEEIYLFNMLLVFVAFVIIAGIIVYNFSAQEKNNTLNYNYSALKGIKSLLSEQKGQFMDILINAYITSLGGDRVFAYLESDSYTNSTEQNRNTINSFLHDIHNGFNSVAVYNEREDVAYTIVERGMRIYDGDVLSGMRNVCEDYHPHLEMTADTISGRYSSERTYAMIYCIRNMDTYKNIGALQAEYKVSLIDEYLQNSYPSVMGSFLVVSNDGEVFYDSSGQWYDQKYPYVEQLLRSNGSEETV